MDKPLSRIAVSLLALLCALFAYQIITAPIYALVVGEAGYVYRLNTRTGVIISCQPIHGVGPILCK